MSTPFPIAQDPRTRIVTLTLEPNQGPMVILDHPLIQRIEASLKSLPADATGLILASGSPRVFIAGADLRSIDAMSHDELDRYLAYGQRVFGMLCELRFPTVAAINGAALGGGLEIAMHCDGLIAAPPPMKDGQPGRPYPIGLPEAGLMICPGWGGTNLLAARIDPAEGIRRTAEGKPMLIDEAARAGLLDAMAPSPEALHSTAAAWLQEHRNAPGARRDGQPLKWIGRVDRKAACLAAYHRLLQDLPRTDPHAAVLKAVHAGLEHGWQAALDVERFELNRLRASPAGKAAIQAFLNKSAAPAPAAGGPKKA